MDVGVKKEEGVSASFSKSLRVTFGKASWKDGENYWRGRFRGKIKVPFKYVEFKMFISRKSSRQLDT